MTALGKHEILRSEDTPEAGGEFTEKASAEELEQEVAELRDELKKLTPRVEQLTRLLEAAKKAPLTDAERKLQEEKADKAVRDAKRSGSDDDIALRIAKVTRERFTSDLRASQIAESPQGRELERLKNRQFDLEERLKQIAPKPEKE